MLMPLRCQESHVCLAPSGNVQTAVELNFFLATTWICRLAKQYEWSERPNVVSPTEKAADHDTGFYNCSVTQSRLFFCVCHTTYCGGSSHRRRSLTQPDLKSTHSAAATTKKEKKEMPSVISITALRTLWLSDKRPPSSPTSSDVSRRWGHQGLLARQRVSQHKEPNAASASTGAPPNATTERRKGSTVGN